MEYRDCFEVCRFREFIPLRRESDGQVKVLAQVVPELLFIATWHSKSELIPGENPNVETRTLSKNEAKNEAIDLFLSFGFKQMTPDQLGEITPLLDALGLKLKTSPVQPSELNGVSKVGLLELAGLNHGGV
jgi:hypothetical protein